MFLAKLRQFLVPAYYLIAVVLAAIIIFGANATAEEYGVLYERLGPSEQMDATIKSVFESITFGLYEGSSRRQASLQNLLETAEQYHRMATQCAFVLLACSLAFIAYLYAVNRARGEPVSLRFCGHLLGVCIVFLAIGVSAPILSLVAYKEVAVVGQVVFKYESKGIATTISTLFSSGNAFIALLLMLFSVLTPIAKLVLCFITVGASRLADRRRHIGVIKAIGKWSMADVLVVAILLAFFALGADENTDSWLGHGLYFFAGYCILSLIAGHIIVHYGDDDRADA